MIFCIVSNIGSVALFHLFFFVIQSTAQQSFFIHFKKRNLLHCKIVADALMAKYVSIEPISPVLIMYTDWCPEHRTTFVSVKIAVIALQTFSDLNHVFVARIAPGHLFRNPSDKINCMLNLELYGIGVMSKPSTASNLSTI